MKQLQVLNYCCNEDIFAKLFSVLTRRAKINFLQNKYAELLGKSILREKLPICLNV